MDLCLRVGGYVSACTSSSRIDVGSRCIFEESVRSSNESKISGVISKADFFWALKACFGSMPTDDELVVIAQKVDYSGVHVCVCVHARVYVRLIIQTT